MRVRVGTILALALHPVEFVVRAVVKVPPSQRKPEGAASSHDATKTTVGNLQLHILSAWVGLELGYLGGHHRGKGVVVYDPRASSSQVVNELLGPYAKSSVRGRKYHNGRGGQGVPW